MADPVVTPPVPGTATPTPVVSPTPPAVDPVQTELGKPVVAAEGAKVAPAIEGAKPGPTEPKPGDKIEAKADAPVAFDPAKLTLPEGMKTDDPLFQGFTATIGDDKLDPQARGQKLLDLYKDGVKAVGEANTKAWTDLNDQWIKEVKADPEIGGPKFEATKTTIAKAIDSMGEKEATAFRQALDMTGAGNNPAIWRGLAKLAAVITEGGHVTGKPSTTADRPSVKEAFYPNSPDMK